MKHSHLLVSIALMVGAVFAMPAWGGYWEITRLTDNDEHDMRSRVSGDMVVWQHGVSPSSEKEIHLYDGQSIVPLTDNDQEDWSPRISGSNVVWLYDGPAAQQVMLYDGVTTQALTDTSADASDIDIHGPRVTWRRGGDIFLYDNGVVTPLGNGNLARVSDTHVAWDGGDGDPETEIFLYDGTSTTQVTNDVDVFDMNPEISGQKVVWHTEETFWDPLEGNVTLKDAFLYDGSQVVQLTNHGRVHSGPKISGDWVVWDEIDGITTDVFLYDGQSIIELTPGDAEGFEPVVGGSLVVWKSHVGGDNELFVYDGSSVVQLTGAGINSNFVPHVDGTTITWTGKADDGNDYEVYMASYVPEPATMGLLAMGGMALLRRRRR